jgi:hypothetical protein
MAADIFANDYREAGAIDFSGRYGVPTMIGDHVGDCLSRAAERNGEAAMILAGNGARSSAFPPKAGRLNDNDQANGFGNVSPCVSIFKAEVLGYLNISLERIDVFARISLSQGDVLG